MRIRVRLSRIALVGIASVAGPYVNTARAQSLSAPVALGLRPASGAVISTLPADDLERNSIGDVRDALTTKTLKRRAPASSSVPGSSSVAGSSTARSLAAGTVAAPREPRTKASPWWAPVASAVLPGAGQFAMGQQRTVAYLVAEGFLLVQAVAAQRDGNRNRDEYRALASDVARRSFGGSHPIGVWKYYETMEEYSESGAFDQVPGGAIDPESDEGTYNGASWKLARENFWTNPNDPPATDSPEYQRALSFYVARAIRDEFRWSWRDAQLQQDVYRQTIASANRTYQRAVSMVGLIGANHLASLIDAYVTVRVRRYGGVRVAGLTLDGVDNSVRLLGDPAEGRRQFVSTLRFVPGAR